MLEIELLSLFPSYVKSPLDESILKRAIQKGLLSVHNVDIRSFTLDKWNRVDDRPFGGGPGMVLQPEPVAKAIASVKKSHSKVIYLSPQGVPLTASLARSLSKEKHLILLAGHYEGIDQRVVDEEVDLEVSIGDVVLTNGCLAALVLIDSVSRFIPGVLGDEESAVQDSFENGLLDHSHYTKPLVYHKKEVPSVLRSGDHKAIERFRMQEKLSKTLLIRPDLVMDLLNNISSTDSSFVFLSSSLSSVRSWYKKLFGLVDCEGELGFYCTISNISIYFLTALTSSWGAITLSLSESEIRKIEKKVRLHYPESILSCDEKSLILQDPENRLIRLNNSFTK